MNTSEKSVKNPQYEFAVELLNCPVNKNMVVTSPASTVLSQEFILQKTVGDRLSYRVTALCLHEKECGISLIKSTLGGSCVTPHHSLAQNCKTCSPNTRLCETRVCLTSPVRSPSEGRSASEESRVVLVHGGSRHSAAALGAAIGWGYRESGPWLNVCAIRQHIFECNIWAFASIAFFTCVLLRN